MGRSSKPFSHLLCLRWRTWAIVVAEVVRSWRRYWHLAHVFLRDAMAPATECHRAAQQWRDGCSIFPPESCHWSPISCLGGTKLSVAPGFPEHRWRLPLLISNFKAIATPNYGEVRVQYLLPATRLLNFSVLFKTGLPHVAQAVFKFMIIFIMMDIFYVCQSAVFSVLLAWLPCERQGKCPRDTDAVVMCKVV